MKREGQNWDSDIKLGMGREGQNWGREGQIKRYTVRDGTWSKKKLRDGKK